MRKVGTQVLLAKAASTLVVPLSLVRFLPDLYDSGLSYFMVLLRSAPYDSVLSGSILL